MTLVSALALPLLSTVRTTEVRERGRLLGVSAIEANDIEFMLARFRGEGRRAMLAAELLRLRESNEAYILCGREFPVVLLLRIPGLRWEVGGKFSCPLLGLDVEDCVKEMDDCLSGETTAGNGFCCSGLKAESKLADMNRFGELYSRFGLTPALVVIMLGTSDDWLMGRGCWAL